MKINELKQIIKDYVEFNKASEKVDTYKENELEKKLYDMDLTINFERVLRYIKQYFKSINKKVEFETKVAQLYPYYKEDYNSEYTEREDYVNASINNGETLQLIKMHSVYKFFAIAPPRVSDFYSRQVNLLDLLLNSNHTGYKSIFKQEPKLIDSIYSALIEELKVKKISEQNKLLNSYANNSVER